MYRSFTIQLPCDCKEAFFIELLKKVIVFFKCLSRTYVTFYTNYSCST